MWSSVYRECESFVPHYICDLCSISYGLWQSGFSFCHTAAVAPHSFIFSDWISEFYYSLLFIWCSRRKSICRTVAIPSGIELVLMCADTCRTGAYIGPNDVRIWWAIGRELRQWTGTAWGKLLISVEWSIFDDVESGRQHTRERSLCAGVKRTVDGSKASGNCHEFEHFDYMVALCPRQQKNGPKVILHHFDAMNKCNSAEWLCFSNLYVRMLCARIV